VRGAEALAAAEALEPPPALVLLARRFGLSRFEQEVLLLAAAPELDTGIASLCAAAQGDAERSYPTLALAMSLFDAPAWEALSPERPLRSWRLLDFDPASQPLLTCPLRTDERTTDYIKGLHHLDSRLTPLLSVAPAAGKPEDLPPSQRAALDGLVQRFEQAARTGPLPFICLTGPDAADRQRLAWHAAALLGLRLYRLPVELLPSSAAELETLSRLWQREYLLGPVALYLQASESASWSSESRATSPLGRLLERCNGVFFVDAAGEPAALAAGCGRPSLVLDVARPTPAEQRAAWAAALGPQAADHPERLASQFSLGLADIERISREALDEREPDAARLSDRLWAACLVHTRPRLEPLAEHLRPRATWNDLVLPVPELELLREIAIHVRGRAKVYDDWGFRRTMSRGLGISALFAGESGTGKTLAAEVLANDLRLHLCRIDLSAVVNKYIGETEKNLRRVFDAAEDGGAILFFDEADALFGKRTEVKDSHDRYANIEINYLLQRMESYRGLAILASNRKSALDPAFLRRLRFLVNFPFPGPAERRAIWERVLPAETPRAELDFDRLARLNLTGGSIHQAALNAAFRAAEAGTPVTMRLLLDAARAEFRKLDRPISEGDFR
jgi:hypothetical protein